LARGRGLGLGFGAGVADAGAGGCDAPPPELDVVVVPRRGALAGGVLSCTGAPVSERARGEGVEAGAACEMVAERGIARGLALGLGPVGRAAARCGWATSPADGGWGGGGCGTSEGGGGGASMLGGGPSPAPSSAGGGGDDGEVISSLGGGGRSRVCDGSSNRPWPSPAKAGPLLGVSYTSWAKSIVAACMGGCGARRNVGAAASEGGAPEGGAPAGGAPEGGGPAGGAPEGGGPAGGAPEGGGPAGGAPDGGGPAGGASDGGADMGGPGRGKPAPCVSGGRRASDEPEGETRPLKGLAPGGRPLGGWWLAETPSLAGRFSCAGGGTRGTADAALLGVGGGREGGGAGLLGGGGRTLPDAAPAWGSTSRGRA
jgi:hypothetical protein